MFLALRAPPMHTQLRQNSFFPSTSSFKLFVSCIFLFFLLLHELLERWSILYVDCWDTRRDKATTTASSRGFRSLSRSPCCWHKEWKTRLQQAASIFLICSSAGWLAGQWTPPSSLLPDSIDPLVLATAISVNQSSRVTLTNRATPHGIGARRHFIIIRYKNVMWPG